MRYLVLAALLGCHSPELVTALERGDVAAANQLLDHHADLAAEDESGDSALMLATWHGNAALVKRMILAGADPNHANAFGATALHWAVDDPDKVRVLLDAGANPNARDSTDATPLARAAERDGNTDTIAMMLAHGGDPKLVGDRLGGDPATLPALIAGGAPTQHALIYAAIAGHVDAVEVLLARHVDPNTTGNLGMTALMWAAEQGYTDVVEALLAGGANPNIVASFNRSTALIHAASSDRASLDLVTALLDAHADVSAADDEGANALTWAIRRGDPQIISAIASHVTNARPGPARLASGTRAPAATPLAAIQRAIPLLEKSRPRWRERAGCPSCHHDALPALALAHAAPLTRIDTAERDHQTKRIVTAYSRPRDRFLQGHGFGEIVEAAYLLVGLDASGYPPDATTGAMARYLELQQSPDGRFATQMQRQPSDGSDVALTALAIRALQRYANAPQRIARARDWLEHVGVTTNEDIVYRMLGLHWAGVAVDPKPLLARQKTDGSFAQNDGLPGDVYATAQAIVALREAANVPIAELQHAQQFLLARQYADGSWFTASRALRFQPFLDSGFPHGRSQYMAIIATSWVVMALSDLSPRVDVR